MAAFHVFIFVTSLYFICAMQLGTTEQTSPTNEAGADYVSVQFGRQGIVPCEAVGDLHYLYWRKGPSLESSIVVIELDLTEGLTKISGQGYQDGSHNITENMSLVIYKVNIETEGQYLCDRFGRDGTIVSDRIFVNVWASPMEPYPTINECQLGSSKRLDVQSCSLPAKDQLDITCYVDGYYPDITLDFRQNGKMIDDHLPIELNNHDGTKKKTLTIKASVGTDPYECVASSVPGIEKEKEKSAYILLSSSPARVTQEPGGITSRGTDSTKTDSVKPFSILWAIIAIFAFLIVVFVANAWIRRKGFLWFSKPSHTDQIDEEAFALPLLRDRVVIAEGNNPLTKEEVKVMVSVLSGRHCRRFANFISRKKHALTKSIDEIILENEEVMFDTEKMLLDWFDEDTNDCSEKRSKLREAISTVRGKNVEDYWWLCDVELRDFSQYILPSMAVQLFKIIGADYKETQFESTEARFHILKQWRDYFSPASPIDQRTIFYDALEDLHYSVSVLTNSELQSVCERIPEPLHDKFRQNLGIEKRSSKLENDLKQWRIWSDEKKSAWNRRTTLIKVLESFGFFGILAQIKGNYVYTVELKALADSILKQDIFPFMDKLGIGHKFNSYRKDFHYKYLQKGTYHIMAVVLDATISAFAPERGLLTRTLRKHGYPSQSQMGFLGHFSSEDKWTATMNVLLTAMSNEDLRRLCNFLKIRHMDLGTTTKDDNIRDIIHWTKRWKNELYESYQQPIIDISDADVTWRQHRDFNNQLVSNGFYDFAYEVMMIEQPHYVCCKTTDRLM